MMKMSKLFLVLGYLLLFLGITQSVTYDFFYFVQTWPGAYCQPPNQCNSQLKTDFGIHGLWPMNNDGTYPKDCDPSNPFDINKIRGLVGFLRVKWPSLPKDSSSEKFWAHEWDRHGTCSVFDEYPYFQTSLRFKDQTSLLKNLKAKGIEPNGKSYKKTVIENAIKETLGYTPVLICNKKGQLYEIYLCVDTQGKKLITCPYIRPDTGCDKNIEFPPFNLYLK